ncbi:hypothetical protein [Streptomyces caatingaensis]|uniref:Secreted protein n=1 Tax=Streptomyces caatingaensis TaxID=1678637 RepID=A0A0K9XCZ4_9ACTN|nr:hypothetical protein [Streptomyces caatingaensis]KNB50996.1 hypothetical protein AC230_17755 [Streptomyces caatingaensis]
MKRTTGRRLAVLALSGAALLGAPPAFADISAYSPNGKAWAATGYSDTRVWLQQVSDGSSHADYYRGDGSEGAYHLWNKRGPGQTTSSGSGATIYKLRVCEWVPKNDDNCGSWQYR